MTVADRHRRPTGDVGHRELDGQRLGLDQLSVGLDGIANRILAAGGTFRLDSPQGGPTSLEVTVPCAS